ncbi:MAG: phage protein [Bilophila wadsworthia]
MGHSYSFLDVQASIYGPGGNVSLAGDEAGVEQGGITVTPAGERSKMTVGADGSVMHSLLGDNPAPCRSSCSRPPASTRRSRSCTTSRPPPAPSTA